MEGEVAGVSVEDANGGEAEAVAANASMKHDWISDVDAERRTATG